MGVKLDLKSNNPTLYLYGDIWKADMGDAIDALSVIDALAKCGQRPVDARINSPGGDVFEGLAIYHAFQRYQPGVTCYVDALAASAASVVALGGKRCVMSSHSMLMIHNAWTMAAGNADEMRKCADTLDKVDAELIGIYSGKSGLSPEECRAMLAAETWFSSGEALAKKLCDEVTPDGNGVQARVPPGRFKNTPKALLEKWGGHPNDMERLAVAEQIKKRLADVRIRLAEKSKRKP